MSALGQPVTKTKISVRDLNFRYRTNHALKSINIDIPEHRVTAFIGPSGCGKSTLIRCINRMNDFIDGVSISGQVLIDGQDLYDPRIDPVVLRKNVGMVFQKANPFPMSIYDNVAYGPKIHGVRDRSELDEIVQRCLTKAALWEEVKDKLRDNGHALSGGQQQRLCIARTLAVDPKIILMDEPCSALDPVSTARIEDLMYELKQDYTIIIVTHNMQQAQRASDFTAFFMHGSLVEYATTQNLFMYPSSKTTEDYISGRFG